MATSGIVGDKYRYLLQGDIEKNTKWKFGSPTIYEVLNKLFEEGRTKLRPLSLFVSLL